MLGVLFGPNERFFRLRGSSIEDLPNIVYNQNLFFVCCGTKTAVYFIILFYWNVISV